MTHPTHIGKYQVERRLGGGGMAEVFLARVVGVAGFTRPVAIKRVLPSYADNAAFAEMFVREAQLSSRLNHPNIVSVVDFDRDAEHGLFLAMEMVEGRDLHQLLLTGLLPIPVVIHLVTEILRGLGYAHELPLDSSDVRGLVHRDVSPHNVLLSWEGAVKVSDFGIAKARVASNASASVIIKGKPAYMSPEQVNGKPLDGRSDLFAVGIMLWEMLIGRTLFGGGGTMEEVFAALFFAPIAEPRAERPDVPQDLSDVTMRLLQRDRDQRFATAEDAVRALLACRDAPRDGRAALIAALQARFPGQKPERSSQARDAARPSAATPAPRPASASARRRTSRLRLAFVAVGIAAALATFGIVAATSSDNARPTSPAAPLPTADHEAKPAMSPPPRQPPPPEAAAPPTSATPGVAEGAKAEASSERAPKEPDRAQPARSVTRPRAGTRTTPTSTMVEVKLGDP